MSKYNEHVTFAMPCTVSGPMVLTRQVIAATGTLVNINFNSGNEVYLDLSAASSPITVTFSNGMEGSQYLILVDQGATLKTITWPPSLKGNTALAFPSLSPSIDLLRMVYDGNTFYGDVLSGFPIE